MKTTNNASNMVGKARVVSVYLKVFLLMIVSSFFPLLSLGLYELIKFHHVVYGKNNPIMTILGASILLSFAIAGVISRDITTPVKALIKSIENYRLKKQRPNFGSTIRADEFGFLFHSYEQMIFEIERYQSELLNSARLATIGATAAMVAHDVRRPLASMQAFLKIFPTIKDKKDVIDEALRSINSNIIRVDAMLNEILDFSRNNVIAELKESDLENILNLALDEVLASYSGADVVITRVFQHEDFTVLVDNDRFYRVVVNLLSNALDAMSIDKIPHGRLIFITRIVRKNDKNFIEVTIRDDGKGIPKDVIEKIFTPFFSHGKSNGSGLGLAICKNIMEIHHGSIAAKNNDIGGADFVLEILAGENKVDRSNKNTTFDNVADKKSCSSNEDILEFMRLNQELKRPVRLLIVDDDLVAREEIKFLIDSIGVLKECVEAVEAINSDEVNKILKNFEIDYAIIDMDLGKNSDNGDVILKNILSFQKETVAVLHSNKKIQELGGEIASMKNDRFLGFIKKPMRQDDLLQFLAKKKVTGKDICGLITAKGIKKNVLLLNDDMVMNWSLRAELEQLGVSVLVVLSVEDALKCYADNRIDFIISDINLGKNKVCGYDFLQKIREKDAAIPFVFVSASSRSVEWSKAQSLGANAYIQIPCDSNELQEVFKYEMQNRAL